jgi:hypothetical protein
MKLFIRATYKTLLFVSLAIAHGNDGSMDMVTTMSTDVHASSIIATPTAPVSRNGQDQGPTSYFFYAEHSSTILAHIVLMTLGWCFILPPGELSSRSVRNRRRD